MKQKFRRFMAGFLAILTMFTTLFTNGTTAFAASSSANISFWYASAKDHGVISEFNSNHKGGILYAMIDGHSAYCMNFGLSAKGGQLMNSEGSWLRNLVLGLVGGAAGMAGDLTASMFKRKMGNPDMVIFFTGAMSHKMLQGALGEIKGQDCIVEYCPTSSVSALRKVLEKYA